MNKDAREFIRQCHKDSLRKKHIVYHKSGDDTYRTSKLFGDTEICEGGWYCGRKWMTAEFLDRAETRAVKKPLGLRATSLTFSRFISGSKSFILLKGI